MGGSFSLGGVHKQEGDVACPEFIAAASSIGAVEEGGLPCTLVTQESESVASRKTSAHLFHDSHGRMD